MILAHVPPSAVSPLWDRRASLCAACHRSFSPNQKDHYPIWANIDVPPPSSSSFPPPPRFAFSSPWVALSFLSHVPLPSIQSSLPSHEISPTLCVGSRTSNKACIDCGECSPVQHANHPPLTLFSTFYSHASSLPLLFCILPLCFDPLSMLIPVFSLPRCPSSPRSLLILFISADLIKDKVTEEFPFYVFAHPKVCLRA